MTRERITIFALSSGRPPCAIAIIRISGPQALVAARAVTGRDLPGPRQAALRHFREPGTGELIDEGLLLWFPAAQSITGEPLVELHCHGSQAVVRDLQDALAELPGLRAAEAGDFTRRAFANGRMDLASVEGLGDLLTAETAQQRRAAMAMMGGALSRKIEHWTGDLRRLAAQVEARLDFSDEGDVVEAGAAAGLADRIGQIADEIARELAKPSAERLKDGVRVAIGGPPNAGKSTFFNALIGRDAAIVSPIAGTTRDIIEASVAIGGIPMVIADSAGLRDSDDAIERIGVDRAEALLGAADIILWLGDQAAQPTTAGILLQVRAKADLVADGAEPDPATGFDLSAVTGEGMDRLIAALTDAAGGLMPAPGDYALSQRQRQVLARAAEALHEILGLEDEILVSECLRMALTTLDELTGRATTEAVLDELFSGFCIGK
ncbi:MAG TPA: tRNA uridine-5-carboxymethylaminomethyl(34) synthesis GTPase MnmE [Sphingobium sp.]|nr:tRNA uridine-5-carboxymethylaminomethyl(34) synthesis GTPase MnmE [Sphingobium sp.]